MLRNSRLLVLALAAACGGGEQGRPALLRGQDTASAVVAPPTREAAPGSPEEATTPPPAGDAPARDRIVAVFMGTSLTAGLGLLRDGDRYTARLQALADSADLPVEIVNAGVSGETSAGGLRRLDWVLRRPTDVLVIELGANDGLRGLDPAEMEDNLRAIIRRARERWPGVRIVLAGMEAPPNLGPRYTERFRSVFPRVARDLDATLVPFLLDGVAGVPELNQSDRIHPNAEGHRRIAREILWPVLEPVLRAAVKKARDAGELPEGGHDASDPVDR